MPMSRARRGRPGHAQEDVIEAAVELFNRHGYDATSMGMLAERLGISKSAIYHHVPGKEQLLGIALDRALHELESILDRPEILARPEDERVELALRAMVGVLVDDLPHVTLLLRLRGNTPMERRALERRRAFDRRIAELIKAAAAEGRLRDDLDPGAVTRLLFGMVNSITEWYRPHGTMDKRQLADTVIAIALQGLRPRA
ncbi:MAG: TetR/AcrR family transcriptional regulator [Pseudoclavibacter sp.]|nr:TetR/AcrR family transcriptional regulator [Pseudoclavibacter sp.]